MTTFNHSGYQELTAKRGMQTVDLMGALIAILVFMIGFVGVFGMSAEGLATELETQNDNAFHCLSLAQEALGRDDAAFADYMQDAQEALLFSDKPCH